MRRAPGVLERGRQALGRRSGVGRSGLGRSGFGRSGLARSAPGRSGLASIRPRRGQAAEIAATGGGGDVGDATVRYLLYGLLPGWFAPGLADWVMHRRTRIEDTSGSKESLIHSLMMAEIGAPIALTLRYEINPLLLSVQLGCTAVHEATALWDVRTAVESDREVRPVEQHIHSFLESLPFAALSALMCLHADQVRSLLRGGRGDPDAWRLVPRRRPLSPGYLAGIGVAIGACVLLPYGEELLRCLRAGESSHSEGR